MTKVQEIMLKGNKEQIPLVASLVAAAKEHGVSAKEFRNAAEIVSDLIETELLTKPLAELWEQVETTLKSIEEHV